MYDLIIRSGTIVTTAGFIRADLGVRDGRIAAVAVPETLGASDHIVDARGKHVLPGLVDAHAHLREPGFTYKEDVGSGTQAAAAGGVTTVMAIPNTNPPLTTPDALHAAAELASRKAVVDFAVFAGACMADPEGVTAFSDKGPIGFDLYDDPYAFGSASWVDLFCRVRRTGLPLAFYLSDKHLQDRIRGELEDQGVPAAGRFARTTTAATEVAAMARIIPLAAHFDVPVVLRAVTTPEGLAFVREVRLAYPGARVAVEMCVHHLFLTTDELAEMGNRALMLPPLRPRAELDALWRAVRGGTVDYLCTDHAPHAPEEKTEHPPFLAPPGIIGLETWLPLLLNACAGRRLTLPDVVRLCCEQPARTYGIFPRKGAITIGADADLILVNLDERWRIDGSRFYSRGDRGPFDGWVVTGRPYLTMVRGRPVMIDGAVDRSPWGRFVVPESPTRELRPEHPEHTA
ncbi:MAG TPA: dihydroorotase family protein [bacterium]|nr:dihydroorotase family protein [bacterium]